MACGWCCCVLFGLYLLITFGCFGLLFVASPFDFVGLALCGFGLMVTLFSYVGLMLVGCLFVFDVLSIVRCVLCGCCGAGCGCYAI